MWEIGIELTAALIPRAETIMAEIYPLFGVIPEHEIDGVVDEHGVITPKGRGLLKRIGVETESDVSIKKSTIRLLINLYNEWKRPRPSDRLRDGIARGEILGHLGRGRLSGREIG